VSLEPRIHEGERLLARIWKAVLLQGALAIAFAVVLLVWPHIGLTVLIALFGAFALVSGLAMVMGAFSAPIRPTHRAWLVFAGLVGVAIAAVLFVWPNLSAKGLLYLIAAWAVAAGTTGLALALVLPLSGERSLLLALGALVELAFGVVIFAEPGAGAIALLAPVAALLLVSGVMRIAFALELRRVDVALSRSLRRQATTRPLTQA
jgi:uncharacterized membrane protein HdeD (DUF308 family)